MAENGCRWSDFGGSRIDASPGNEVNRPRTAGFALMLRAVEVSGPIGALPVGLTFSRFREPAECEAALRQTTMGPPRMRCCEQTHA